MIPGGAVQRKIAANYIFLPGFPLVRQGYVVLEEGRVKEVVDMGGEIHEIAALEFYGGMLVAGYVEEELPALEEDMPLLPFLEKCYQARCGRPFALALLEGADLRQLCWKKQARLRKLS